MSRLALIQLVNACVQTVNAIWMTINFLLHAKSVIATIGMGFTAVVSVFVWAVFIYILRSDRRSRER
jgi:hypothetical protein